MPPIQISPLEIDDFSGGMTENILLGDNTRFAKADNFWITVDRKLLERDGTILYDSAGYSLPNTNYNRISSLFSAVNETRLFAASSRDLFTQVPDDSPGTVWSAIKGPTGNEAIGGGGEYNQISTAEFQRQVYYTSDALALPGKVFRDQNNTYQALTAGMPKMAFTADTIASLLTDAVNMANAIRASMISHFNDQANATGFPTSTNQHSALDKWSLSYFVTQSWSPGDLEYPGPQPVPTPAPAATDLPSLKVLTVALALAYEHHRNDLSGPTPVTTEGPQLYHQPTHSQSGANDAILFGMGISTQLVTSGTVTDIFTAITFLNDLYQKWYWHQLTPMGHSLTGDYSMMSKYLVSLPKIGTVYPDPSKLQVTPNYAEFIAFATWVKTVHNAHVLNTSTFATVIDPHPQADLLTAGITFPDPFDFDSAALTIFWARFFYGFQHVNDSQVAVHTNITFTTVANSFDLTSVDGVTAGGAITLNVGDWVHTKTDAFNDVNIYSRRAAQVTAAGAGTATLSKSAIASHSGVSGETTASFFHVSMSGGNFVDSAVNQAVAGETLATPGSIGTDLNTWVTLGVEYLTTLGTHINNAATHLHSRILYNELSGLSPVTGNPFYIPSVVTYAWACFYRYSYVVEQNGIFYLNQGSPVYSDSIETLESFPVGTQIASTNTNFFNSIGILATTPNATLTGIPPLVNNTLTNYDTTVSVAPIPTTGIGSQNNLTIEIYRTTDGGTTFYYEDSITNGTLSYLDLTNENFPALGKAALDLQKTLYTSGGVLPNDAPPPAKYITELNGFFYYGSILDTGQYFPGRVLQSKAQAPDSVPAANFDDLEDELVGLSKTRSALLGLCQNSIYRIEGTFDSLGNGSMSHEAIAQGQGCLNAGSIVETEIGVFYAGTDGFYYTDGYQVLKISIDLDTTYQAYTETDTQKNQIVGCYDRLNRRVWWAMQSDPSSPGNDIFFIFYLNYGVKPSGVFTRAFTTQSWMPASATYYKRRLIIGDERNYLFKSDPLSKSDPKVVVGTTPTTWINCYTPWEYLSTSLDFGTTFKRKWVTRLHHIGENVGDVGIQINTINGLGNSPDGSNSSKGLAPIQYTKNFMWGDPNFTWGDSNCAWSYSGAMDVWRRFPANSLRSDFRQIQYLPGNFNIYRSDSYPFGAFATVDSVAKTATILTPVGYTSLNWPLDVVDYFLSFDSDNYATSYLITALQVSDTQIVFSDPNGTAITSATAKWQISGFRKDNKIKINCFVLHYGFLGSANEAYPGEAGADGQGENG